MWLFGWFVTSLDVVDKFLDQSLGGARLSVSADLASLILGLVPKKTLYIKGNLSKRIIPYYS